MRDVIVAAIYRNMLSVYYEVMLWEWCKLGYNQCLEGLNS